MNILISMQVEMKSFHNIIFVILRIILFLKMLLPVCFTYQQWKQRFSVILYMFRYKLFCYIIPTAFKCKYFNFPLLKLCPIKIALVYD